MFYVIHLCFFTLFSLYSAASDHQCNYICRIHFLSWIDRYFNKFLYVKVDSKGLFQNTKNNESTEHQMELGMQGFKKKKVKFYCSIFLSYFFIFPYIPIRHDLLSDPGDLDVFYITHMAAQLFSQFVRYFRTKSLKTPWKKHCHCNYKLFWCLY